MAIELLPDELWNEIEPLLPPHAPQPKGGHPWTEDRPCLVGILFVLRTGLPWQMIPKELGCGSGSTCWRRLRDWTRAGVWAQVHRRLLNHLGKLGQIDWSGAIIDSASVRAVFGGPTQDQTPRIGPRRAANDI
jgi:transposase